MGSVLRAGAANWILTFALAYCGLADNYGWCGRADDAGEGSLGQRQKEFAQKALELDPDLGGGAHVPRHGTARRRRLISAEQSEKEFDRAAER